MLDEKWNMSSWRNKESEELGIKDREDNDSEEGAGKNEHNTVNSHHPLDMWTG